MTDAVKLLSDDDLREIEAMKPNSFWEFGGDLAGEYVPISVAQRDVLCQTVRALRQQVAELTAERCECGHAKTRHGFFSDHDECYECDQMSDDLCCEWRPAPRETDTYTALREQLAQARIELEVVNGVSCKEEQDAGNGPCGICRACLQSQLAQCNDERWHTSRLLIDTQNQLAQVTQERDYWRTQAGNATAAAEKWYRERY